MSKYIFITGGVVSSLGKGITAASIGRLLKAHKLSVNIIKCDPYLNVDAGTMAAAEHGEVFITADGAKTDLDLGYYERFLGSDTKHLNIVTTGQIYQSVIARERSGGYLGQTVQVVPHITNEIKERFKKAASGYDICIIEIGGTVGDIESLPFLEAARQMRPDRTKNDVLYLHVTLVPYLHTSDELKTKPTQHSVNKLREIGIDPDIIACRCEKPLERGIKDKIALFTGVPREAVIDVPDAKSIYEVPFLLERQGLDEQIMMLLRLRSAARDFDEWIAFSKKLKSAENAEAVKIAIAGKYTKLKDSYKSLTEALWHGCLENGVRPEFSYIDTDICGFEAKLAKAHCLVVPGGFGTWGFEGKVKACGYARAQKLPFLGICLGMQCAAVEFARAELGLKKAMSTELDKATTEPVIDIMEAAKKQYSSMAYERLGNQWCRIKPGTKAYLAYKQELIKERHRNTYELNSKYIMRFEQAGMIISAIDEKLGLAEIIELKSHPWFIATQFHPEFASKPLAPSPLFVSFIAAAKQYKENKEKCK